LEEAKAVEPVAAVVTGCEQYRAEFSKYDWDVRVMMAIMEAESTHDYISCDPNAVGDNYVINGLLAPSCGLLQIRTLVGRPTCEQLKDPTTNVEWGYKIFTSQGLSAWSKYTNGGYLEYLK